MDKRTKIMAGLFGLMVLYFVGSSMVYPQWIEPLMTFDKRIAKKQKELDKLEAIAMKVEDAKRAYFRFMDRSGALDIAAIENDIRARLNELIDQFGLTNAKVSRGRPSLVPKTKIGRMVLTISAEGTLASTIGFLREMYEMPHLARIGNVSLAPKRSGRRKDAKTMDRVTLRAPLEIWTLPQHRMLDRKVEKEDLVQPERVIRHEGLTYSKIWERTPFMEFVPYPPLKVNLPPAVNVQVDGRLQLQGSAQGGDGEYTYQWSPSDGLTSPNKARTNVETKTPANLVYTLTVRDNSDHTTAATVTINITEKPKPPPPKIVANDTPPKPRAPVKPVTRKLWPNRNTKRLSMTLSHWQDQQRVDEVLVHDAQTDESTYYSIGDEFDGGELIYIHPRGVITRWINEASKRDEYFIYPIGSQLSGDLKPDDAADYPYLRLTALQYRSEDFHGSGTTDITLDDFTPEADARADVDAEPVDKDVQKDQREAQPEALEQPLLPTESLNPRDKQTKPSASRRVQGRKAKQEAKLDARREWDEAHRDDDISVMLPSEQREIEKRQAKERRKRKKNKSFGRRN